MRNYTLVTILLLFSVHSLIGGDVNGTLTDSQDPEYPYMAVPDDQFFPCSDENIKLYVNKASLDSGQIVKVKATFTPEKNYSNVRLLVNISSKYLQDQMTTVRFLQGDTSLSIDIVSGHMYVLESEFMSIGQNAFLINAMISLTSRDNEDCLEGMSSCEIKSNVSNSPRVERLLEQLSQVNKIIMDHQAGTLSDSVAFHRLMKISPALILDSGNGSPADDYANSLITEINSIRLNYINSIVPQDSCFF